MLATLAIAAMATQAPGVFKVATAAVALRAGALPPLAEPVAGGDLTEAAALVELVGVG